MSVETCHYRLSLRGKPIGNHILSTYFRGRTALLESKLMLQGRLSNATVKQKSKVHRHQFFSFSYQEETLERKTSRTFEVVFDIEAGIVSAKRGSSDRTEIPYIRPFQDPLGLLYQLRKWQDIKPLQKIPMLGKDVFVEHLGDTVLNTVLGEKSAHVYHLRPGGSYVYVDKEAPNPIVKLTQKLDGHHIDVILVKITHEPLRREVKRKRNPRRSNRQRHRKRSARK